MGNVHFGITMSGNEVFDPVDIAARLFLCPRISASKALKLLELMDSGKTTVDMFLSNTDVQIQDLNKQKANGAKVYELVKDKLTEWANTFLPVTDEEFKYIEDKFGYTKVELTNEDENTFKGPLTAKNMAAYVKRYIKGQDNAVDKLSVQFYLHLLSKHNKTTCKIKSPILSIGPTGVGKSEMLRLFGVICDCPVIRINTSEVVPESWKGLHVSDLIASEFEKYSDPSVMEYSVIVIHEVDKIAQGCNAKSDAGVDLARDQMRDIMRFFENGHHVTLDLGFEKDSLKPRRVNLPTDNFMIMLDGAFDGIEEIIKKRKKSTSMIGFSNITSSRADADGENKSFLKYLNSDDLKSWGFMPELIGRIGNYVVLNHLSTDAIYDIMKNAKNNVLQEHIDFCSSVNVDLQFDDEAVRYVAEVAHKSGLGFRNVKSLLAKALSNVYYDMPESSSQEKMVVKITKEYVMKQLNENQ